MTDTIAPAEAKTLLEFLLDLLTDDHARQSFEADPHKALADAGLGDVTLEEIKDLLPVVLDRCDPHRSADYEHECHHYEGPCPPVHCPPHLAHCDDRPSPQQHEEIDKVVTHLNYVTNNYAFDSHDTIFNNSTSIVNLGSGTVDFDQSIDFHPVSADHGGTAVGGDNNAPITPGDGNVIGDGNQVAGQSSTAAFGTGASAVSHPTVDHGGAFSLGGPASGSYSTVDNHAHTDTHTTVNGHGNNIGDGTLTDSHDDNSIVHHGSDNVDDHTTTDNSSHLDTSDSGNVDNSQQDNSGLHLADLPIL